MPKRLMFDRLVKRAETMLAPGPTHCLYEADVIGVGTPVAMTFYPHERVFTDSPVELLSLIGIVVTLATILASAVTWYRHSRCQQTDCRNRLGLRRHGKYPYGHLKLCHVHHPLVPNDGQITAAHVDAVSKRLES